MASFFIQRPKRASLKSRFMHGAFWITAGSVIARISGFVTTIFIARFLGKEGFGEYGIIRNTADIFVVLGAARMGTTATKYVAQYHTTNPIKAERVLAMSQTVSLTSCLLMTAAMGGFAPLLATHTLGRPNLAPLLAIGSLFMFFTTFAAVTELALSGFEAFQKLGLISLLKAFLLPITAIALTHKFGLKGLMAAITFNAGLELLASWWFLRVESMRHQIRTQFSFRAIKYEREIFIHFALPGILTGLLTSGGIWMANAFFVNQPDGYASLGLFNAANQWRMIVLFLPDILSRVALPIMSNSLSHSDVTQFGLAASLNLRSNVIVALPLAMIVIVFRHPLMELFGDRFHGSVDLLPILMFSAFSATLTNTVNNTLTSIGKRWFTLIGTVIWAILLCWLVASQIIGSTPRGLALAYAISYTVYFLAVAIYSEFALPGRILLQHWKLLAASFIMLFLAAAYPYIAENFHPNLLSAILLIGALLPISMAFVSSVQQFAVKGAGTIAVLKCSLNKTPDKKCHSVKDLSTNQLSAETKDKVKNLIL
jgi:O-antigen/teichoic acid export membrane protein